MAISGVLTGQGTWFRDLPGTADDKADIKLAGAMRAKNPKWVRRTVTGVGTAGGIVGKIVGGAFARGSTRRVNELANFYALNEPFDSLVMFGTSRGSGIITRTTWKVMELGCKSIDLVVLFDPVYGSWRTGEPFYSHPKQLAPIVKHIVVVRAVDELGFTFPAVPVNYHEHDAITVSVVWVDGDHGQICNGAGATMMLPLYSAGVLEHPPRQLRLMPREVLGRMTPQRRRVFNPHRDLYCPLPDPA